MPQINQVSSHSVAEDFKQIEQNEKWVKSADKVEITLMCGAILGIVAFAIASSHGATWIALGTTLGGISTPMFMATLATAGVRRHLDRQTKKLKEGLSGERLLAAAKADPKTLEKFNEKQWTDFVKALDKEYAQKEDLEKSDKWLFQVLNNFPRRLADNLFFISEGTLKHLDKAKLNNSVKSNLDLLKIYFNNDGKLAKGDAFDTFVVTFWAIFGGGKPLWVAGLSELELLEITTRCREEIANLQRSLPKIVGAEGDFLLNAWSTLEFPA